MDHTSLHRWSSFLGGSEVNNSPNIAHSKDPKHTSMQIRINYSDGKVESVSLDLEVDVLGEKEVVKRKIKKKDLHKYDIDIGIKSPFSLEEFTNIFTFSSGEDDTSGTINVDLDAIDSVNATVELQEEISTSRHSQAQKQISMESTKDQVLPELPSPEGLEGKENKRFYEMMEEGGDSQPNTVRKIIYEEKSLTRDELEEKVEQAGYSSSSSGVATTLRVLEEIGEIKRRGRGSSLTIEWIGE